MITKKYGLEKVFIEEMEDGIYYAKEVNNFSEVDLDIIEKRSTKKCG